MFLLRIVQQRNLKMPVLESFYFFHFFGIKVINIGDVFRFLNIISSFRERYYIQKDFLSTFLRIIVFQ